MIDYILEPSRLVDLKELELCQKSTFPNALSAKLDSSFRIKMLEWYITNDRGVLFHVKHNNRIVGYCGGIITKSEGLSGAASNITQYAFKVFLFSFIKRPWLLFHEESLKKISLIKKNIFIRLGFIKLNQETQSIKKEKFKSFWGLVVIGVKSDYQGKGLGSLLLQHFEELARIDQVQIVSLSVKTKNTQAIDAYKKNNWKIVEENKKDIRMKKIL